MAFDAVAVVLWNCTTHWIIELLFYICGMGCVDRATSKCTVGGSAPTLMIIHS